MKHELFLFVEERHKYLYYMMLLQQYQYSISLQCTMC